MAFQDCPYHSNLARPSYFLYQDFHGPASDLLTGPPHRMEGPHRIIRGGPWHEWLQTQDVGHFRYRGDDCVVRGNPPTGIFDFNARCWCKGLTDGVVEADLNSLPAKPAHGLCFRMNDAGDGLAIAWVCGAGSQLRLWRIADGLGTLLATTGNLTPSPSAGVWSHLEVSFQGPIIQASVYGTKVLDVVCYEHLANRGCGLYQLTDSGGEHLWRYFRLRRKP